MALGTAGSSEMARQIGAELNEKGNIRVNEEMETTVPGLYAAGDCTEAFFRWQKRYMMERRQAFPPVSMCGNFERAGIECIQYKFRRKAETDNDQKQDRIL